MKREGREINDIEWSEGGTKIRKDMTKSLEGSVH